MVMPVELINSIKQRAHEKGLSITAYMSALVLSDLGRPSTPNLQELTDQVLLIQSQVEELKDRLDACSAQEPVDLL